MHRKEVLVAPSILSANFLELGRDIDMLNNSNADWIHVDIMDGTFVPNISFGGPILEAVNKVAKKPLDVHVMIDKPDRYIEKYRNAGAELLSVHYEGSFHLHRTIELIKELGMKAGVVLNPHTSVKAVKEILPELHYVLLMSVNPGFGGQKFIESTYDKVKELRKMIDKHSPSTLIQVDGGVNADNAPLLRDAGADCLVAGSAVFKAEDPIAMIDRIKCK